MRYIIGFLIVIGLIVLVFVLFLTGGSSTPKKVSTSLTSYAGSATVMRFTIDGPITADQTHRAIQITVGRDDTDIDIIQGYQHNVLDHGSFANNQDSYTQFLRAIDLAGYTKVRTTKNTDDRGVCPLGDRYIFEIVNGVSDVQRTWATSCGGQGTFGGGLTTIMTLFQKQIPDYNKRATNVNITSQTF
jgi:hypothetical protein